MAASLDKKKLKKELLDLYKKNQNNKVFRGKVKELMQSTLREFGRSETTQELYNIYSSGDSLNEFLDSDLFDPDIDKKPIDKKKKKSTPKKSKVVTSRPRSRSRSRQGTTSRAAGTMADDTSQAAQAARTLFGQKRKSKKIRRRKSKKYSRRRKR